MNIRVDPPPRRTTHAMGAGYYVSGLCLPTDNAVFYCSRGRSRTGKTTMVANRPQLANLIRTFRTLMSFISRA